MRSCGKKAIGCRVPCFVLKAAGIALAASGLLLTLIFSPVRMWLALLGLALFGAGLLLTRMA